jgi:putative exosortase-associated protein (TIGR04073 family)
MKSLLISLLSFAIFSAVPASAYDDLSDCESKGEWINSNDPAANAFLLSMDKLGRGVENTAFGVLEIPKQTVKRALETGCSASYVSGFFIGIGYFLLRELAGVYEILTFPFPIPVEYSPVMDPLLAFPAEYAIK